MKIKVQRVIEDGKNESKVKDYPETTLEAFDKIALSEFRNWALAEECIEATDQFLYQDEAIAPKYEPVFRLSDFLDSVKSGAFTDDGVITVWSKEHIAHLSRPAELTLKVKRQPKGTGDGKEKTCEIMEAEFNAMTLDRLRARLEELGYILPSDKFFSQGVAIDVKKESSTYPKNIYKDKNIDVRVGGFNLG